MALFLDPNPSALSPLWFFFVVVVERELPDELLLQSSDLFAEFYFRAALAYASRIGIAFLPFRARR